MTSVYSSDRTLNYAFLLGGITALIFGIILLIRQDEAVGLVALLLGLWWLIQGAFLVFSVFIDRTDFWWKLIIGLIGVAAGIIVLSSPVESGAFLGSALAIVLGILGIVAGVMSIIGGFRGGGFSAFLFGIVSAVIGALLIFFPETSFSVLVTILAIILILEGLAAVVMAFVAKPQEVTSS